MFPLGHAAFGYLVSVVLAWSNDVRSPDGPRLAALLVGTQFPDLVDKQLGYLRMTNNGRTGLHSVFVALPLVVALRRVDVLPNDVVDAFAVGYASHLVGDVLRPISERQWRGLQFLFWPLVRGRRLPRAHIAPWTRVLAHYRQRPSGPALGLVVTAVVVWARRRSR